MPNTRPSKQSKEFSFYVNLYSCNLIEFFSLNSQTWKAFIRSEVRTFTPRVNTVLSNSIGHKIRCWLASSDFIYNKKKPKQISVFTLFLRGWHYSDSKCRYPLPLWLLFIIFFFFFKKKEVFWRDPEHQSDNYCIL